MRKYIAALLFALSLVPALGQAPPPVPALPDAERRTQYTITAQTGPFSVGFALYGDSTDYGNWIEVYLTTGSGATAVTTKLASVTDYTLSSATGSLGTIPRPITDATITLTTAKTGTLQIVGARRPRRTSQFAENRGVAARDLNQVFTDILATMRETWDRTNDITGRALLTNPGESIGSLPSKAARSGGLLGFNTNGDPIPLAVLTGLGNVIGPNTATVGHIATFGNTAGTILLDGGLIGAGNVVGPAGSTDGAIALFNGTIGATIKNGPSGTTTTVLHGNAAGAPSYAAVSLTADVSGLLPLANGGTNASLTASLGGIPYSTASAFAILSGTATASLPLLSGSSVAPTWATIAYPGSATSGGIPYFSSSTVMASSTALAASQIVLGGGAGTAPATLGSLGTATTLLHGNASGAPTFAAVGLTTDVTGTLPLGNGGLGIASGTSGGLPYFSSGSTVASSALLTANALMVGGGAAAAPTTPVSLGTTTTVLHGNAAGVPSFGAVALTSDVTGTLPVANGGTGLSSGTSGGVLGFTATGAVASSAALTANQIVIGGGPGATPVPLGSLGSATTVLHGNGSGVPSFSAVALTSDVTGALPIANGGTGQGSAPLARSASGLNIDAVTTFGNANYAAAVTDRVIATSATLTAQRAVSLPITSSFNSGQQLVVVDSFGGINGANTLVIAANAADSINGLGSITISAQYGGAVLWPIGSNKWGYVASSAGGGGGGTVTTVNVGAGISTGTGSGITVSGTLYALPPPQGRLTLSSLTPVMTSDQTAKSTLYYDCYNGGGVVPYYNGTADLSESIPGCEVSTAMVSAASAGQVVSGNLYDVWWVHSGANRICLAMSAASGGGGGWSSDTAGSNMARGTGYSQLDFTSRSYITNKNSITNCFNGATNYGAVASNQATYLGTIYATANGQTGMALKPSAAAGGSANILGVYNAYNRVPVIAVNRDNTSSWTYATATWRRANNSASNAIKFVDGLQQSQVECSYLATPSPPGTGNIGSVTGCMVDWSSGGPGVQLPTWSASLNVTVSASVSEPFYPVLGLHQVDALETSQNSSTITFFGSGWGAPAGQTEALMLRVQM